MTTIHSATIQGVTAQPVTVEVDLLNRLSCTVIAGLPSASARETAARVRYAIEAAGKSYPQQRVAVSVGPTDQRKTNPTSFDLPIALAVLAANGLTPEDPAKFGDTVYVGELSLRGELRSVRGILPIVQMARDAGRSGVVVPVGNAVEAALVTGIDIYAAHLLADVVAWVSGTGELPRACYSLPLGIDSPSLDLAEVRGQKEGCQALEAAAVGGHNLLLIGPPGCGKAMLAVRLPGLLPSPTKDEALEVTAIRSVAGLAGMAGGLWGRRPFRAPHHTVSTAGLVGTRDRPGEATLAHRGVLFLDDLPEFRREALTALASVVAKRDSHGMPADFLLVASTNPCPCGLSGAAQSDKRPSDCRCSDDAMKRHWARLREFMELLSITVSAEVERASLDAPRAESSAVVQRRVVAARRAAKGGA